MWLGHLHAACRNPLAPCAPTLWLVLSTRTHGLSAASRPLDPLPIRGLAKPSRLSAATHGQTRRRADRIVVSELDVRELQIPDVLLLVDDHSQHLGHSVVHPLNASVTVGR